MRASKLPISLVFLVLAACGDLSTRSGGDAAESRTCGDWATPVVLGGQGPSFSLPLLNFAGDGTLQVSALSVTSDNVISAVSRSWDPTDAAPGEPVDHVLVDSHQSDGRLFTSPSGEFQVALWTDRDPEAELGEPFAAVRRADGRWSTAHGWGEAVPQLGEIRASIDDDGDAWVAFTSLEADGTRAIYLAELGFSSGFTAAHRAVEEAGHLVDIAVHGGAGILLHYNADPRGTPNPKSRLFSRSLSAGGELGEAQLVLDDYMDGSYGRALALDGEHGWLAVASQQSRDRSTIRLYAWSSEEKRFGPALIPPGQPAGRARDPHIVVAEERVLVTWYTDENEAPADGLSPFDVWASMLQPGDSEFSTAEKLDDGVAHAVFARAALRPDGHAQVAWQANSSIDTRHFDPQAGWSEIVSLKAVPESAEAAHMLPRVALDASGCAAIGWLHYDEATGYDIRISTQR